MKTGRNSLCFCGSGKKYKHCCLNKKAPISNVKDYYLKKYNIRLKSASDIEKIRKAGKLVMDTHKLIEPFIKDGVTTDEINTLVHDYTIKNSAICAPLNYKGFPKSVCVSINDEICHGIPSERKIKNGDIVNVDITSILDGYYADANKTYMVGEVSVDARKLVNVAKESLRQGLLAVKPNNTIGDIGYAILQYAESMGCSVVRSFVGHGVGFGFHEPPQVPHFGRQKEGVPLVEGMVFTVEPMINLGKKDLTILEDGWTAITKDGSLSAQFEQTVVVTRNGYESLTPFSLKN